MNGYVPDYVHLVREFIRVVKPGGVIYIDHECSPDVWSGGSAEYSCYKSALTQSLRKPLGLRVLQKARRLWSFRAWRRLALRKIWGINDEGDIHVTSEDHIEWDVIERLCRLDCDVLRSEDYLVCREHGAAPALYQQYCGSCADMRLMIFKKL